MGVMNNDGGGGLAKLLALKQLAGQQRQQTGPDAADINAFEKIKNTDVAARERLFADLSSAETDEDIKRIGDSMGSYNSITGRSVFDPEEVFRATAGRSGQLRAETVKSEISRMTTDPDAASGGKAAAMTLVGRNDRGRLAKSMKKIADSNLPGPAGMMTRGVVANAEEYYAKAHAKVAAEAPANVRLGMSQDTYQDMTFAATGLNDLHDEFYGEAMRVGNLASYAMGDGHRALDGMINAKIAQFPRQKDGLEDERKRLHDTLNDAAAGRKTDFEVNRMRRQEIQGAVADAFGGTRIDEGFVFPDLDAQNRPAYNATLSFAYGQAAKHPGDSVEMIRVAALDYAYERQFLTRHPSAGPVGAGSYYAAVKKAEDDGKVYGEPWVTDALITMPGLINASPSSDGSGGWRFHTVDHGVITLTKSEFDESSIGARFRQRKETILGTARASEALAKRKADEAERVREEEKAEKRRAKNQRAATGASTAAEKVTGAIGDKVGDIAIGAQDILTGTAGLVKDVAGETVSHWGGILKRAKASGQKIEMNTPPKSTER